MIIHVLNGNITELISSKYYYNQKVKIIIHSKIGNDDSMKYKETWR